MQSIYSPSLCLNGNRRNHFQAQCKLREKKKQFHSCFHIQRKNILQLKVYFSKASKARIILPIWEFAQVHFSEEVETWMNDHRFSKNLLEISMIFVISRVSLWFDVLTNFSQLKNCKCFSSIPPLDLYLNGTPAVTFRGMLIDIDTYIQKVSDVFQHINEHRPGISINAWQTK